MKYFTYCGVDLQRYRRGDYSYADRDKMALLFGTDTNDEMTPEDVEAVVQDPMLSTLFAGGFYVVPSEMSLIVSPYSDFVLGIPDQAPLDGPAIQFVVGGVRRGFTLRQRYNNCLSLYKGLTCSKCPDLGTVCFDRELMKFREAGQVTEKVPLAVRVEQLSHMKTVIGGYTYASPTVTGTQSLMHSLRPESEHDFGEIEANLKALSENAKAAAISRDFKKNNCKLCFAKTDCRRYRSCVGKYPTDDEITASLVKRWDEVVYKNVPWEDWQFWVLANGAGRETTFERKRVLLTGPSKGYSGWGVGLLRAKSKIYGLEEKRSYDFYASLFDLPRKEEDARGYTWKKAEGKVLALYSLLVAKDWGNEHAGFRSTHTDGVAWRRPDKYGVEVQWYGSRHLKYTTRFDSYLQYWSLFEKNLPVEQVSYIRRTQGQSPGTRPKQLPEPQLQLPLLGSPLPEP